MSTGDKAVTLNASGLAVGLPDGLLLKLKLNCLLILRTELQLPQLPL